MEKILGILILFFSICYGYSTIKNPPSGTGSGRRTYIIKDLFISFFLALLGILFLTNQITLSELFR